MNNILYSTFSAFELIYFESLLMNYYKYSTLNNFPKLITQLPLETNRMKFYPYFTSLNIHIK